MTKNLLKSNKPTSNTSVPALDRSVSILDLLSQTREGLSLGEIAKTIAIPKSSTHNLMLALVEHGLVRRNDDGEFSMGTKALQWGQSFNAGSQLMSAFDAAMRANTTLESETVMLAILDNTDVTYLACHPGTRPLAVNFRVGGRFIASCTSSGKAILSTIVDADIKQLYQQSSDTHYQAGKLHKLTKHSLPTVSALCKQMAEIRELGYAQDNEETAEGMQCFGAPVFAAGSQRAVAGVAVSTIKASLTPKRRNEAIQAIRQLANDVSIRLGAQTTA
jgi:IclR family transcriptional regulator, blcABC operon repressor